MGEDQIFGCTYLSIQDIGWVFWIVLEPYFSWWDQVGHVISLHKMQKEYKTFKENVQKYIWELDFNLSILSIIPFVTGFC